MKELHDLELATQRLPVQGAFHFLGGHALQTYDAGGAVIGDVRREQGCLARLQRVTRIHWLLFVHIDTGMSNVACIKCCSQRIS